MSTTERHLRVVPGAAAARHPPRCDAGDLGLTTLLFAVAALPLGSELAGVGRWGDASLGLGTVGVLLAGRELVAALRARLRGRSQAGGTS